MAARQLINVRLSEAGIAELEEIAEAHGVSRSEVLRACMAVAFARPGDLNRVLLDWQARL